MLVARRDPPFHDDAEHGSAPADFAAYPAPVHRLSRFATVMQLLGSLVAVPVGLASAYSLYHSTFSADASCQTLRAGIVSMLDKSVDASTRRMLVRGDVVKFEQNCAAVDPDAVAAFKTLLTEEQKPAAAAAVVQPSETPVKEVESKAEPRPQQTAKQAPVLRTSIASEWGHRDPAVSDTQWLDAVRQAMAAHKQASIAAEADKPLVLGSPPHSLQRPAVRPEPVTAIAAPAVAAVPVTPAPVIAAAPSPSADHPVPPNAIPDPSEVAAAQPDKQPSRISRWIAHVPLLGPVWENGRQ
jgi:hypothetical protein